MGTYMAELPTAHVQFLTLCGGALSHNQLHCQEDGSSLQDQREPHPATPCTHRDKLTRK